MSGPITGLDDFCHVLAASGLVDPRLLTSLRRQFQAEHSLAEGSPEAARAFADHLIAKGTLTAWQSQKLCDGKYKGFFLDHYKLTGHVSVEQTYSRFLAEDTNTHQLVVLCIQPPTKDGKVHYYVEEYKA
jgi:serine/threonine-protein kinase